MDHIQLIKEINKLRQEKKALIVAHYYVDDAVQEIADFVGDSYYLSKVCMEREESLIIFCGVRFMGESAKILNPHKTVVMAENMADCPMAHMIDIETIEEIRCQHDDLAVVCYINSDTEIKAHSDVIVTSSNALHIVKKLPQKKIFFIPDEHLGRYIAGKLPEKEFIFNNGFCHVHTSITKENVLKAKEVMPEAKVLVHPECSLEVVMLGDYVGSTSGIIDYATRSEGEKFIICTEMGVLYELQKKNPHKKFYSVGHRQFCPNMKRVTLEHVYKALQGVNEPIELDSEMSQNAKRALEAMHRLGD